MPAFFKIILQGKTVVYTIKRKHKTKIRNHIDILSGETDAPNNILSIFANQINNITLKTISL